MPIIGVRSRSDEVHDRFDKRPDRDTGEREEPDDDEAQRERHERHQELNNARRRPTGIEVMDTECAEEQAQDSCDDSRLRCRIGWIRLISGGILIGALRLVASLVAIPALVWVRGCAVRLVHTLVGIAAIGLALV